MKKISKFISIILIIVVLSMSLIGCNYNNESRENNLVEVTDAVGDKVKIPKNVKTVVNLVPYGSQIMIALGLGDYLIGINEETVETPWISELYPRVKELKTFPYECSAEALLNIDADIVFVETQEEAREFRKKGINALTFTYYTIEEFKKNIEVLGSVLGDEAELKCSKYLKYLDEKIADVDSTLSPKIKDKESLYYMNGARDRGFYKTTGKGSTNCIVAELSYTEFATADIIEAPETKVDAEAILSKNPENIIIGGVYQHVLYDELFQDPQWKNIDAIKNGNVYKVPMGISAWNRYGIELALMIPWTASVVYENEYKFDALKETIYFYETFTGYKLTEQQADYMLKGLMPNGEKEISAR